MATGIGEALVAARRQQGVALSDAAAETRVRESYLAALEAEDFAALGGDVYVKGFLRSYARFLRLDPEPLIATYRANYERPNDDIAPLAHRPMAPLPGEGRPGMVVGIGVGVLILLVLAVIGLLGRDQDPADELETGNPDPAPTEDIATSEAPATMAPREDPSEGPTTDDPTEVVAGDDVRLKLSFDQGLSWVRVTVDGETQVEGEQPQGTKLDFTGTEAITVRIGDASLVRVRVNGQDLGYLGEPEEVVEQTFTVDEAA